MYMTLVVAWQLGEMAAVWVTTMSGCGLAICTTCCWTCLTGCVVFVYWYCLYFECVTNKVLADLLCTKLVSRRLHFDPELSWVMHLGPSLVCQTLVMQRLVLYSAPRYSSLCRVSLKEDQNHGEGKNDYQQLIWSAGTAYQWALV